MSRILLGFIAGSMALHALPQLLALPWLLSILILCMPLAWWPRGRPLCAALLGFVWCHWQAQAVLAQRVPADFDQVLMMRGTVVSAPQSAGERLRFELDVSSITATDSVASAGLQSQPGPPLSTSLKPQRVRVDWYRTDRAATELPALGERWQFEARLRAPRGPLNFVPAAGGRWPRYDAERQAISRGIDAWAVVQGDSAQRLSPVDVDGLGLDRLRQSLGEHFQQRLSSAAAAVARALLLGDRSALDNDLWRALARTGSSHLIAISGLHIGLAGLFGYALVHLLWWLQPTLGARYPAPLAGAWGAAVVAAAYASLAGLMLPTQRALAALLVGLVLLSLRRFKPPWLVFLWALSGVLLVSPLAPLNPGFWLSFTAVASLIYCFHGRPRSTYWRGLIQAQLAVSLSLAPLTVLFFQQFSAVGPVLNLLAVPWVSLVVLPLGLLCTLVSLCGGEALWLFGALDWTIHALLLLVHQAAAWPLAEWRLNASLATAMMAIIGAAWLLAPRGMPLRILGLLWFAPLLLPAYGAPPWGEFWAYQFDVEQGTAVAVRTRQHVLLYDSGPGDGRGRDWVNAAIAPALQQWGAPPLDLLLISHGDLDHAGGAATVQRLFQPRRVMSPAVFAKSQWAPLNGAQMEPCHRGQRWRWDGVEFEILHPGPWLPDLGNDSSCVLSVRGDSWSLLLPGDIGRAAEQQVLYELARSAAPQRLQASVLALGHHGSRTSSSARWLDQLQPRWVLLSRARDNRFGFPHSEVVQRLRQRSIPVLDSARCGGIWLGPAPQEGKARIMGVTRRVKRWWRASNDVNDPLITATEALDLSIIHPACI